jgi:thiol:disulfide interchange protein DsbC
LKHLIHGRALAYACCALLIGSAVHAADAVESRLRTPVERQLLQTLSARFPTIKLDAVEPSPVPGIYQVIAGNQVVYVDASGDHMIVGRMMDTRTKQDLSAEAIDAHNAIDFNSLPFGEAIKIVKGNGAHKMALFADPDCPYCQRLERDMRSTTDITVYLFLFPLQQVHPHALADAEKIWCSPDRASAWNNWMIDRTPIPGGGSCANDPIAKIAALARSLRINATPTMFLQDGRRIGGWIPLPQLQKLLAQASPAAGHGDLAASKGVPN